MCSKEALGVRIQDGRWTGPVGGRSMWWPRIYSSHVSVSERAMWNPWNGAEPGATEWQKDMLSTQSCSEAERPINSRPDVFVLQGPAEKPRSGFGYSTLYIHLEKRGWMIWADAGACQMQSDLDSLRLLVQRRKLSFIWTFGKDPMKFILSPISHNRSFSHSTQI